MDSYYDTHKFSNALISVFSQVRFLTLFYTEHTLFELTVLSVATVGSVTTVAAEFLHFPSRITRFQWDATLEPFLNPGSLICASAAGRAAQV